MARLSFNYESGMKSVDEYALCQALLRGGGAPKGGWEEQTAGAKERSLVLELGGMAKNHEREPDELSVRTKHSNQEAGGVEEVRGSSLVCIGDEDNVEGELGGEAEVRGRGGCQGEPLHGLPL
jgi:hypothetical protein